MLINKPPIKRSHYRELALGPRDLLDSFFSTTRAAGAAGVKQKDVTNHVSLKHIPPDRVSPGIGTGHEFTGHTIIRIALFFRLRSAKVEFSQAARIIWAPEKENEQGLASAIKNAVERYYEGENSPVHLVLFPGKDGWRGTVIASPEQAGRVFRMDEPIAVSVSVSNAVKTVIGHLKE